MIVAAVLAAADQASKFWLVGLLMKAEGAIELTPFFNLVMVWNRGVSFGFLGGGELGPWPFVALALAIVAGLGVWLWRLRAGPLAAAIGAVIGGAIANVIDRIHYGAVADFFDFHVAGYHWPAFNIADSAIVVGVGVIVLDAFLDRHEAEEQ